MKKIVIVGGHLTPALATIEELNEGKVETIFYGRKYSTEGSSRISAEYSVISEKKIKFRNLTAGRLQRKFTKYTMLAIIKIPLGFIQSFVYLLMDRPSLTVSFGGYLSTPVVFSAWLLGIPSITHEQSPIGGLANKINSLFVEKIYLAWASSLKYFPNEKTEIIGNPVMQSLTNKKISNKKLKDFIKGADKLIYVTGGNQGSHFINNLIFKSQNMLKDYKIIHQVGKVNFKDDHKKANAIKSKNYFWIDYIKSEDLGAVLSTSSLVISRSGANIVWELGLFGKVALLIPLPTSAAGEQKYNAQILEKAKTARVLNQDDLSEDVLINEIKDIFQNYQNYKNNALKFQKTLPADAAKKLAQVILKYA